MSLRQISLGIGGLVIVAACGLGAMILFGGPRTPPPLTSVIQSVVKRDRSDAPAAMSFKASDGASLAYRVYQPTGAAPKGTAVLIHGSVGSGIDMHEVAKALSAVGFVSYTPDMRGHGGSGPRGDIAYIGQLEQDLFDFLIELDRKGAPARRLLIGHSSGGGFALRIAASPLAARFAGTILLSPFLSPNSPTSKPAGGWAGVGIPRIIALDILERLGIRAFSGARVIAFAVGPESVPYVTPAYSYRLMMNFGPDRDWHRDIATATGPMAVVVGANDELFEPARFADVFAGRRDIPIEIVPGVDHMGITGEPAALAAITARALAGLSK